ncbi:MAG: RES family NAD+ phosphorylase [Candidatus Tectomicrobia bacterium]|uniref:RES family NAD+ phosphorylase n=1 Tax=Tectimicrobiota bacterium TaxID=2528274 RepID=A0A932I2H1_UNCTE|nr:RES family NAD+ phosphorylase [Candidatus Tectomicrobia bacterium]
MPKSKSLRGFWEFERLISHQTRYVHGSEVKEFLDWILRTSKNRIELLPQHNKPWRARLGYDDDGDHLIGLSPKEMKPLANRAKEGRANPKGIPCLYLSTDRDTAMAEIRPWLDSLISVAQFTTLRELQIINCTLHKENKRPWTIGMKDKLTPEEREEVLWWDIDKAFSRPVTLSDDTADYVPSQIIADLFRVNGYDGIAYRSSLGEGHNIALFDLNSAELINCQVFELKSLSHEFRERNNPYFVKVHPQKKATRKR